MKRIFSSPILALVIGAAMRLFFVWKFPAGSGDTVIYDQLATNWLKHAKYAMDIAGPGLRGFIHLRADRRPRRVPRLPIE
jgi:hypothetical protein